MEFCNCYAIKKMKFNMPELKVGMLVEVSDHSGLHRVDNVFPDIGISVSDIERYNSRHYLEFNEIISVSEYDDTHELNGFDTTCFKKLYYKEIWNRKTVKRITKEDAEILLEEEFGEPVEITEV